MEKEYTRYRIYVDKKIYFSPNYFDVVKWLFGLGVVSSRDYNSQKSLYWLYFDVTPEYDNEEFISKLNSEIKNMKPSDAV